MKLASRGTRIKYLMQLCITASTDAHPSRCWNDLFFSGSAEFGGAMQFSSMGSEQILTGTNCFIEIFYIFKIDINLWSNALTSLDS